MKLAPYMLENIVMDGGEPVMHLGFGGKDHNVREPKKGKLYG